MSLWTACITSHQADVANARPPIRAAAPRAARGVTVRSATATSNHSTGAAAIINVAVMLTAPTLPITRAQSAASRHLVRVAAPIVSPMIHPSPLQGSSIDDVREMYGTRYGDSWYSSPAAIAACVERPRRRPAHATPVPAASMIVPIHKRWATQSGRPISSATTYHGPLGHT